VAYSSVTFTAQAKESSLELRHHLTLPVRAASDASNRPLPGRIALRPGTGY